MRAAGQVAGRGTGTPLHIIFLILFLLFLLSLQFLMFPPSLQVKVELVPGQGGRDAVHGLLQALKNRHKVAVPDHQAEAVSASEATVVSLPKVSKPQAVASTQPKTSAVEKG